MSEDEENTQAEQGAIKRVKEMRKGLAKEDKKKEK